MTNPILPPEEDNLHNHNHHYQSSHPRVKLGNLLHCSEPNVLSPLSSPEEDNTAVAGRLSNASAGSTLHHYDSGDASPYPMSPWSQTSPYIKSPWTKLSPVQPFHQKNCLIGTLLREEGHVYSLAVRGRLLYTGSESKNIRVWKDFHDAGGFKSSSGLVKAIVISGNKVFTGHQDGKIRIWKFSSSSSLFVNGNHKRVGTLPTLKDYLKKSINPNSYVEVRRHHKVPWIKHYDAISCLTLNAESGLLYSGSWDKTIKVWRLPDGKCLESIEAHDDAINSIVVGLDGLVFSGSADGTVKVWRRELVGKTTRHVHIQTLLKQQSAVTSLAVAGDVSGDGEVLYGGSSDGIVNFWEREKGETRYGGVLRGHKKAVLCLATAGKMLFSGSADKTICVWKRVDGTHLFTAVLAGHSGPVKCLAVDEDVDGGDAAEEEEEGRRWIVYSGSLDKSVKIWRVTEEEG